MASPAEIDKAILPLAGRDFQNDWQRDTTRISLGEGIIGVLQAVRGKGPSMDMGWLFIDLGLLVLLVLGVVIGLVFFRDRLGRFGAAVQFERARELFLLQRERLHRQFFQAAAHSGSPRGLHWKACDWEKGVEFVRDRHNRQIVAFAAVTIHFEAIEGSDMEGLPAVGMPRNASAIFFFQRGHWHTSGRAVFNKNPDEAALHFQKQYEHLGSEE